MRSTVLSWYCMPMQSYPRRGASCARPTICDVGHPCCMMSRRPHKFADARAGFLRAGGPARRRMRDFLKVPNSQVLSRSEYIDAGHHAKRESSKASNRSKNGGARDKAAGRAVGFGEQPPTRLPTPRRPPTHPPTPRRCALQTMVHCLLCLHLLYRRQRLPHRGRYLPPPHAACHGPPNHALERRASVSPAGACGAERASASRAGDGR